MKINIEFDIELPDLDYTEEELEAYLRYIYQDNGSIDGNNPFMQAQLNPEPVFGSFNWNYED